MMLRRYAITAGYARCRLRYDATDATPTRYHYFLALF